MDQHTHPGLTGTARNAALGAGVLGLISLGLVLGGEIARGTDFMGSGLAELAGWLGFAAACLLALGVAGLVAAYGSRVAAVGRSALAVLTLATAAAVGAAATLALVVPALADRAPDLANDPPAAVPAVFILSGLAMGVSGLVLARAMRRDGLLARSTTTLLVIASVVAMVPLPSRFFLLGFAVAAVLGTRAVAGAPERAGAASSAQAVAGAAG